MPGAVDGDALVIVDDRRCRRATTPVVTVLCACAAIGAAIAPAIAAMASILFRMVNSFASDSSAGNAPAQIASQCIARGIVPGKRCLTRGNFGQFSRALEPVEATGVSYSRNRASG